MNTCARISAISGLTFKARLPTDVYGADYVSLHVRETNHAAYHLYSHTLKFAKFGVEVGYYADKENAFDMRKALNDFYSKHMQKSLKGKVLPPDPN